MRKHRFPNYYSAKFARQQKEKPTDWLILSDGPGWFKLVNIGVIRNDQQKSV